MTGVEPDDNDVKDLCQLKKIDEESLLRTLHHRHQNKKVYTRIGGRSIMLSVNPYVDLPLLYAQDKHDVPGGRKLLFSLSNVQ